MRIAHEFAFDLSVPDEGWLDARLEKFGATRKGGVHAHSLYLDTPDGAIARLGLGIGLRRTGRLNPNAPARRRQASVPPRWTRFVEELAPAPHPRAALEARLRDPDTREALALAASRETDEALYSLQFAGAALEIRADRSVIRAAGRDCLVATVTLRHVAGEPADFLQAVRNFADCAEMCLCAETVMIRARRHLGMGEEAHIGAFSPRLGRAMDMRAAFQAIARTCFDQFLRNEAAVRKLRDSEAVHQCRVALRRLRAAFRLFKLPSGKNAHEAWRADLKHVSALLRDARDLDVLIGEQVEPLLVHAPADTSGALLRDLEARREMAYDKLVATLQGAKARSFYLDVALWIEAGDFGAPDTWSQSIVAFSRQRLSKQAQKLLARGNEIEQNSEPERHRTRIAAKNLRYSAEFLESLLPDKTARKRFTAFISALKKIQEILGAHNDEIAARHFLTLLTEDLRERDPGLQMAVAAAAQTLERPTGPPDESEFLQKTSDAFEKLADAKHFWVKIRDGSKS